ncbi:MAG TPA: DUF1583 domain-containing protein, partial [Pirellulales bacterium]
VGQELENRGELSDLAMKLYEATADNDDVRHDFSYSPLKRLVGIYHKAGRDEDARTLLFKLTKGQDYSNYDARYAAYQRVSNGVSIGEQLAELGYPADAARVFNDLLADPEAFEQSKGYYRGGDQARLSAEQGLAKALQDINPEHVSRTVEALLTQAKTAGDEPPVDLALLVQPRDLARAELTSILARLLKSASKVPEARAAVDAGLKQLASDYAGDFSVQIAVTLAALAGEDEEKTAAAVARLQSLMNETPLEELPAGARPNARQRSEAARQVGLWLVARECLKQESLREAGGQLAERAVQAARRQADPIYALAMLREQGQTELERGDREAAQRAWSRMLELVLPRPAEKQSSRIPAALPTKDKNARRSRPARRDAVGWALPTMISRWQASASMRGHKSVGNALRGARPIIVALFLFADQAAAPPVPARAAGLPAATLPQFDQAMEIAKLASEHDLHELSLRAVREALRPGPPALPMKVMQGGARVVRSSRSNQPDNDQTQIAQRVEQRLSQLDAVWKRHSAPPEAVYDALVAAIMPEGRPGELTLYAPPLAAASLANPTSGGKLLVEWTMRAGRADSLRKQVVARLEQPLAQLPGHVLLAQLAQAGGDRAAAIEHFAWLAERISGETLQSSAELACHAALPALADDELAPKAIAIVETAAKNLAAQTNQNSNDEPAASLLMLVGRHQLRHGDAEAGRKHLLDYLAVCQQMNMRYVGEYGVVRRKEQLAKVATELALADQLDEALDMLGQFSDTPTSANQGQAGVAAATTAVLRQLALLPADERYERLSKWSLPANDRKSVRLLAGFMPRDAVPEAFASIGYAPRGLTNASGDLVNTFDLLVDSAREAGQLDALAEVARQAASDVDQKVENAAALYVLAELARGRPENARATVSSLTKELSQNIPAQEDRSKPTPWSDYLAANVCASNAALHDVGGEMLTNVLAYAQRTQDHPLLSHLRIDLGEQTARRAGGGRLIHLDRLVPWQPAVFLSAGFHRGGAARPWWSVDGKQAVHVGGAESDHLIFNYPLTGTFEISADLLDGRWAEANLGYGGLCLEEFTTANYALVYPVGHHEQIQRTMVSRRADGFNRYTIQVEPGSVRFLINGQQVFHEADASSTAPWLDLFTSRERTTAFRNVRISGKPTIPREVQLVKGDRLDGWLAHFYNESQPPRLYKNSPNDRTNGYYLFNNALNANDYDWRATDGVIHGRRALGVAAESSQSRLHYMRPLGNGETLRYEFFYEPDAVEVHPALDRLVFLLAPEGLALHWMTDGDADSTGLAPDNVASEPANRRGANRLPLKPGEWNEVALRLIDGGVTLRLNGQEVDHQPLDPTNDRLFSLFHFKHRTAAQVRNVVLSGDDWPAELDNARLANLLMPFDADCELDSSRLADALLGEENVYLSTWDVWRTARTLPAAERYAYLLDWVLPDPAHGSVVRLYGDFTPTDPIPATTVNRSDAQSSSDAPRRSSAVALGDRSPSRSAGATKTAGTTKSAGATSRIHLGGELVVPAIELVSAAAELGKLDELKSRVDSFAPADVFASRGQAALLALVYMAANDDARAQQAFQLLEPSIRNAKKDEPEHRRWPALVAGFAAIERNELQPIALALLNQVADASQGTSQRWQRIARHVFARAQLASEPDGNVRFGRPLRLKYWHEATHATAASRGQGLPLAHWQHRPGGIKHYAGHDRDYLYFAVPLRGSFELEAELSTFGWREIETNYAALLFGLIYDRKSYSLWNFERARPNGVIDPPLGELGDFYHYRLQVKDGQYTAIVNGRQIFSERLPDEPDPWLAFRTGWGP